MNALNTLVHLGPLNGGVLATFLVLVLGAVAVSLHRVHRGEPVPVLPLTVVLLLPLLFSTWASTWQYDHALTYTVDVPNPEKQRFIADMLSRVLATQVWSGAIAALGAVGLLGGSLALTVRGERPRWLLGGIATALGLGLVMVATVSLGAHPALLTAVRVGGYGLAAAISVWALIAAHRKGPGRQLATLVALALPLAVAGLDVMTVGGLAIEQFVVVARLPVAEKQEALRAALAVLDGLQSSAWVGLVAASGVSLCGALLTRRGQQLATFASLAAVLLASVAGVATSTAWALAFY